MFSSEEGAYWILFSSEPINLEYDKIRKTTITSASPFTGMLRIAYIPAVDASDTSTFSSTGLRRLIYHAGVYPTGGEVSWEFHSQSASSKTQKTNVTTSSRHATVHFSFGARSMTDDSIRPKNMAIGLLMLALPHHVQVLPKSVQLSEKRFDLTYKCIKGPLTPIVGSFWSFEEPLLDLNFDAPNQNLDAGVRRTILSQVEKDMVRVLPTNDENVYGFGKQVARLAQLAHIAKELESGQSGETGAEEESSLVQKGKELLFSYLENFLTSQVSDFLLFDANMGGLVSKNGLMDKSADFGNGR
jgi:endo-1,3(4)-beta-glucanase